MDDLLSAALAESGLDEFLSNDCNLYNDAGSTGGTDTSDVGTSPSASQDLIEKCSTSEHSSPAGSPKIIDSEKNNNAATPRIGQFPTVSSAPVIWPESRVAFRQKTPTNLPREREFSGQTLIKRTVNTPNGPQIQLLRPYTNEKGETCYRQVKMQSNNGRPGSPAPRQKVVVVKQNTPNGPRYVRQVLPPGAEICTTVSPGGTVTRKIVTRKPVNSSNGQQGPISSNTLSSQGRPFVVNRGQPSSRPPTIRRVFTRGGAPLHRGISRPNGSFERQGSRPGTPLNSRPGSAISDYSPVASPGFTLRTPLAGVSGSSPALSNMQSFDFSQTPQRGSEAYLSQLSPQPKPLRQLTLKESLSQRPSQPQLQRFSNDSFDSKASLKPREEKPLSIAPTKSSKAKEEMKQAMQTAKERRLDDDEDENLGYAETYSDYRPAKLRSGLAHPDSVVETASLSSVAPPDVIYQVSMPEFLIDTGAISALQLEAVIYACQAHDKRLPSGERTGYLIGDGAGVGKGRTVACIIFENYLLGRKRSIWLSVSSDLKFDSERDLRDIGAGRIKVHALNKLKYAKINGSENGFVKKGCLFATYSSLIGECRTASKKYRSRLNQLVQWFGVEYDGVIIFDECHRAKNLVPGTGGKPTKTGKLVLELQKKLPNARIVYASATGATEPRNMAYMTRLGLWGEGQAFPNFSDFINAVERRGVGAMEIVAMDMKQRGLYLARQLSFRGVSFRVEEVTLSDDFIKVYDESVKLWMECRRQFQVILSTMSDAERSSCKHIWGQFWAAHQRFFKYLCIGAKVDACVRMTREAIKSNKCAVIGLQSTGESRTNEVLEESGGELTEFVSTAKAVLQGLIEKHFPLERGNCVDVFRDFDRMFDDSDRPKKRKIPSNPYGFDVLDELGLSLPSKSQSTKRGRFDNDSADDESEEDEDEEEDEDDEDESDSDTDAEVKLGDNEEDWFKAILAEAASSSDSDNDDDEDEDSAKSGDSGDENKANGNSNDEEDEFNPFFYDFAKGDPYIRRAKADNGKKKKKMKTEEELAEERRQRRIRKKRKKRKIIKEHRRAERKKQKRELQTQAMQSTANEFITSSRLIDGFDINPKIVKAELLAAVERLGPQLPVNTLDQLIDELGGPEFVAEMTGRKGRIVTRPNGDIEYEPRSAGVDVPLELMNMDEKDKFMKGEKLVAVISEAASSGISLQSDRRAQNQRRRVHITLELPWSADKAIQQFGRTHRSNQVSAPEYVFLISELAGEKRFASIVAKRLESLGALTHGDRRATETRDLSQFNMDTKYGRAALDVLLKSVIGTLSPPLIAPPTDYKPGDFFADMRLYMEGVGLLSRMDNGQYTIEREGSMIAKFLNRILGLPVHAQNSLFQYFTEIVNELIAQAKHDGTYDMGIMDLGTGGDEVRKQETRIFLGRAEKGSYRVEINKIGVDRGVPWEDAFAIYQQHNVGEDGFYVSTPPHSIRQIVSLVYGIGKRRLDTGDRLYALTRPATGRSPKMETFSDLSKRFKKLSPEEAEPLWRTQFESASKMCQHSFVYGRCRNEENHKYCEVGRSTRTYFVLSGSVLSVWPVVEQVLNDRDTRGSRIQVIRIRTTNQDQEQKIVGLLVLPQFVRQLVQKLEEHCGRSFVETKKAPLPPPPPLMKKEEILDSLD